MHDTIYIVLACGLGLLMTWGVGANDLANVMSPTMGSKAISVRLAMIIAIVFEFAGAIFGGHGVSETVRSGIINLNLYGTDSEVIIWGMLSVLTAGTIWMALASFLGLPVSITNTIIGAIAGFGAIALDIHAIYWREVGYIALSWLLCPMLAAFLAYTLFMSVQRLILGTHDPIENAQRYLPLYLFIVGMILSSMTIIKGFKHYRIYFTHPVNMLIAISCGLLIMLLGMVLVNRVKREKHANTHEQFAYVEKLFSVLMVFTACAMVFAHGSNDVSISVGPVAAVISIVQGHTQQHNPLPTWVVVLGCSGVVLGLLMYGRKVIATVGSGITALTPSRAFAATLSAATMVVISTGTGIPVSATQTLVGAVLGVGLARGIGALNLTVIRNIFLSWMITIPTACVLTMICFTVYRFVFSM